MQSHRKQSGLVDQPYTSGTSLRAWEATALFLLLLPGLAFGQARTPVMVKATKQAPAKASEVHTPDSHTADLSTAQAMASVNAESTKKAVVAERVVDARILPLFGERSKSPGQIEDEIHFLNDCDQNFTSREEASQFFASRGWEYIAEAQLDTAAYRFNLAYILNDKNPDVYWGLGVVSYQRNQLTDAVRMLKRGVALSDTNAIMMTDLATVELEQYQAKSDTASLEDAREHLQKALFLRPDHATAYSKLSIASYLQADYRSAWMYLHKAYKIEISSLDLTYLQELIAKQPDPLGIFK
ncbi:tetratricopeptide repeat protein [uncultured Fibrella sp.]|uniref:tetratricopeptide repeat protein n=1 Tax=uncultured Fibrella sp. TaxID=1284596 RepID=UPI0035C9C4F9